MLIEDTASAIAFEIRQQFDIPENETIPKDVWDRFCNLNLLTEAHKNREVMSLSLSECEQIDAQAKSMADKPNYVIRWLLLNEIRIALKIKEFRPLKIRNKILFEKDIQKIVKVIKANKPLLKELGFSVDKDYESYPFKTIKKLLLKKLDLKAEYKRGFVNGSQKEQDEIIEHYKKSKIFQTKFGIGQNGWTKELPSRERRWKFCKEEIENIPFKKLNPQQAKYYLSFTPHIEVSQWKYEWKGKNSATKNSESLFKNFNEHLSLAETKLIQDSLDELT